MPECSRAERADRLRKYRAAQRVTFCGRRARAARNTRWRGKRSAAKETDHPLPLDGAADQGDRTELHEAAREERRDGVESIWLGLWPTARMTRVLVMRGASETILKARLPLRPSSIRAVTTLFEAIALWEGRRVRAVLVADDSSTKSCPTTLYGDTFAIFGERTALFDLEWVTQVPARRRDAQGGTGRFVDLERLLIRTVAS